jgi:hypothetical protein
LIDDQLREEDVVARIDLDSGTLPEFERRLNAVGSNEQRLWGTMSSAQMLAHLRLTAEISLEEREAKNESRQWLTPIVYWLMFRVFTKWPHARIPASTQFLDDSAEDVEGERKPLIESMQRFVEETAKNPERITLEPMLGRISLKRWARVHGVHVDYHLRQFGA